MRPTRAAAYPETKSCRLRTKDFVMTANYNSSRFSSARSELITGSVVVASIVMFIWTGGTAMTAVVRKLAGVGPSVEQVLLTTLLLNIALILFGWRRYRDLEIEVRQRRIAEEQARSLAETDPLTGLLNRRSFKDRGAKLIEAARQTGQTLIVMILDLDNFKQVNDIYGHAAGDDVLLMAGERIRTALPPSALLSRMGGDEFACAFIIGPGTPHLADRTAENIVASITQPMIGKGLHLRTSTSIGISQSGSEQESVEALMRQADRAMYSAKKQGRNGYAWFDGAVEQELSLQLILEADIRNGIPRADFIPYFEPRKRLADGHLAGFEMLARWQHPTQGLILPAQFIPIAEKAGLMDDLSLMLMRTAFTEAANWDNSLILSVNISPSQLRDPWMVQKLHKLLVETGLPASRLEVELTEEVLFRDLALAKEIAGSLKNLGVGIVLDRFGADQSSLAHLRALPFDRVKISRTLVSSIHRDEQNASIIAALMGIAENLRLPITAVGIEDEAILTKLRELGCIDGQGWHFGKPMPVSEARLMAKLSAHSDPATEQQATSITRQAI